MTQTFGTYPPNTHPLYTPKPESLGTVMDRIAEQIVRMLEGRLGTRTQLDPDEMAVFEGLKRILSMTRSKRRLKSATLWRRTFKALRANLGKLGTPDETLTADIDTLEKALCKNWKP